MKLFPATWVSLLALQAWAIAAGAEHKPAEEARMDWWREAKFGLFIHWGVYAVPAGEYNGQPVEPIAEALRPHAYSEWIMYNARIPVATYREYARRFNPTEFDAEQWVLLAKRAGMKYIIITAKHHDGFAMFRTRASGWNIVDATPYGKDPLQALAAACRKHQIQLGFYYSQAQDWVNGGAVGLFSMGTKAPPPWDPAQGADRDAYIDHVALPQVRELCSNYGEFPSILWWDTPRDMTPTRAKKLHDAVVALRPAIIMNNRLGGGYRGDTETPEQTIPARGLPGKDWETCMTMNNSWGFKRDDHAWKSAAELVRNLCDIASKGGNYLLNIGPDSQGLIPPESVERLETIGRWMQANGMAIHGCGPTPFGAEAGDFITSEQDTNGQGKFKPAWDWRATTKPGMVFVFLFKWPASGEFQLPGLKEEVKQAKVLGTGQQVRFEQNAKRLLLHLDGLEPDPLATVISLETGRPQVPTAADP